MAPAPVPTTRTSTVSSTLAEYELICELYPDSVPAHNNCGHILLALGRTRDALPMFERAAELDLTITPPLISLYFVYLDHYRHAAEATKAARRLVERAPQNVNFRVMLAWSLAAEGRIGEHMIALAQALPAMPAQIADKILTEKIKYGRMITFTDMPPAEDRRDGEEIKILDRRGRLRAIVRPRISRKSYDYSCVFPVT